MSAMASQITGVSIVYTTVFSGADQRKHQRSTHWPLWGDFTGDRRGIHRWQEGTSPVTGEFPAKRASNAEMFPFDGAIMINSARQGLNASSKDFCSLAPGAYIIIFNYNHYWNKLLVDSCCHHCCCYRWLLLYLSLSSSSSSSSSSTSRTTPCFCGHACVRLNKELMLAFYHFCRSKIG